ncbi:MAG: 2-oxoacid:acceptor oxidoreductase subunit alpha [Negativicutes bacterium]|nr:2-oxoacid:acceptor oxidoreductase subunit alpha [Negativicutes bacterium]
MAQSSYICQFVGEAGYGVMSAGSMVAKAAGRNGLWAFIASEYPSLIKGGLNTCLVRLSDQPVTAYEEELDFLGVMSQEGLEQNYTKLKQGAVLLYDADAVQVDPAKLTAGVAAFPVKLLQAIAGDSAKFMANSAMVGAFCALCGFPVELIAAVMRSEFSQPEIQARNLSLLSETYNKVAADMAGKPDFPLAFTANDRSKMLLNGNEAISMGAIKAGCKFAAGYPMTPGSSVLTYVADHASEYGLVFKQAEDEVAAMNMLIGAGFAGVRAIGATSGGGFALMVEALGFAGQAEVPVVMVEAQRGGPSTGLPTRTAQADLNFVTYASQGEFPRFVIAPGDIDECFYETFRIFNLAEKYQVPCIILSDKYLADSAATNLFFDDAGLTIDRGKLADEGRLAANQPYWRYRQTEDGISLRAIPGQKGGRHIATSYTHGEDGFYSSGNHEYAASEPEITAAGLDKLFRKVPAMLADVPAIELYGPEIADLTIVAWGSTKGAVLEAMNLAAAAGLTVNFLQVRYLSPFPAAAVEAVLQKARQTLLVEGNKTAQLGGMIRANTGYKMDHTYLKYDSRPFVPSAIFAKMKEVLG